ncbi:MAG: sigma-54-dependent Fis family transcriptional regulator [Nitrospinota bacterium]|nr:sigma-54-dependent Fis family transcriptional regulator [Nitrospinota bacterium]
MNGDKIGEEMMGATLEDGFLREVLDGIRDSIKIVDRSFTVVFANKTALSQAIHFKHDEQGKLREKCFQKFFGSAKQCSFCVIDQVFRSGVPTFNVFHVRKDGKGEMREISTFPLTGESGKVEHVIEIMRDVTRLKDDLGKEAEFGDMISDDPSMREIFDMIKSVAPTNSTVLINGETGTGKELVARAIHRHSKRKEQKMVTIHCGAIPDTLLESELFGHEKGAFTGADQRRMGKFELAHKGTLFLDEIGTISTAMQIKILRALQEGEITRVGGNDPVRVDVRFVAATNLDLGAAVEREEFREDLYYRINVIPLRLPPLRDRGKDALALAEHFLTKLGQEIGKKIEGFSDEARDQINSYAWPGNIRELRNLVERAVILCKTHYVERLDIAPAAKKHVGTEATPSDGIDSPSGSLKDVVDEVERQYLIKALKENRGNITSVAQLAGVNTRTIHRKMKDFGIVKEDYK